MKNETQKETGFTLVELMITLVILVILITLAAPSFVDLIRSNRIATQTNLFTTALALARSEAVSRNLSVYVCKSNTGKTCDSGANWEDGWIVFADADFDGTLDVNSEEIRIFEGLATGYTLRNASVFTNWVRYMSEGNATGTTGLPVYSNTANTEMFRLCPDNADTTKARQINIIPSGRVTLVEGATACP